MSPSGKYVQQALFSHSPSTTHTLLNLGGRLGHYHGGGLLPPISPNLNHPTG